MPESTAPASDTGSEVATEGAAGKGRGALNRFRFSRRALLGGAAGAAAAAGAGAVVGYAAAEASDSTKSTTIRFTGQNQAGIVTPAQDRLHFVTFDFVDGATKEEFTRVLQEWTAAARNYTRGGETTEDGATGLGQSASPTDTGEALGLGAASLTLTIGFAPSLFDRFDLEARRPAGFTDLPKFPKDQLEAERSGGDVCIQACSEDPQVAVHAIRNFAKIGAGVVAVRWSQLGFGRTSSTSTTQTTPRNLFGFKDGTANVKAEDTDEVTEFVWIHPEDVPGGASWAAGGSYLIARRINMKIETWDIQTLAEQEAIFGRGKREGNPLSKTGEFTEMDFTSATSDGPVVAKDAHVRLAHPSNNDGQKLLRRGYNFIDGSDGLGHLNAGLFFIAFVRDVAKQFVPMQTSLAKNDSLNEYISHTGSAVFLCPPGVNGDDDYWGKGLFE